MNSPPQQSCQRRRTGLPQGKTKDFYLRSHIPKEQCSKGVRREVFVFYAKADQCVRLSSQLFIWYANRAISFDPSKEWWFFLPKRIFISLKVSKVFRFSVQGSIYFSKKGGQRVLWTNNLWRSNSSSLWNSYIECNVNDIYEIDNTYVCNHWSKRCNSISSRISIRVIWNSSRHSSKS